MKHRLLTENQQETLAMTVCSQIARCILEFNPHVNLKQLYPLKLNYSHFTPWFITLIQSICKVSNLLVDVNKFPIHQWLSPGAFVVGLTFLLGGKLLYICILILYSLLQTNNLNVIFVKDARVRFFLKQLFFQC